MVTHLARKTFACTIGLANGMNIGVLSRILGHASIQVTLDSYATVIDTLMLQNVNDLKSKLALNNGKKTEEAIEIDAQNGLVGNLSNISNN